MINLSIQTKTPYNVSIGHSILQQIGSKICEVPNQQYQKVAVISDSNVAPLYSKTAETALSEAGFSVHTYQFPAGEHSKSMSTVVHLVQWLVEHQFTRTDALVALGGGVTGDLVGFTASIYLRGCDFIQIPTTFLAAVDSSVGGKTGVNIPEGKNLIGAFWQPRLVLCDTATFATLPTTVLHDGIAEAIKYGCIWDKSLLDILSKTNWLSSQLEQVIGRCIEIKAEIVQQDEFDFGLRKTLNFGHTIGHAIEALSGLTITHGQAIAIGMAIVLRSQVKSGRIAAADAKRLHEILDLYSLPTTTSFSSQKLAAAALSDKKRSGNTIDFILLETLGKSMIFPLPTEQVEEFIERGM